jgi:eukaryotic-like serine/threonine-protein kinase
MSSADLEPDETVAPVRSGRMLGRYLLCYELASGGMATVYLARSEGQHAETGFERLVALKIIHPHLARQREFVEMFLDEARIASRIVHPNVCSVFDFGEESSTYFLAMDYLVGETTNRLARAVWRKPEIARRPRTPLVFARLIAEAAEGLHAAHESRADDGTLLGVVHRDVTPQNLFVGYDGSLRVVDFGVALAGGRSHHTAVGTLKGKYPYMSPEQVTQKDVDRRSDVWSLGVCLWEMLAGKRLFRQQSEFETLRAVTESELRLPSELNPLVPKSIEAVVMKALSRDRDERHASARELSRELSAAIGALGGATAGDVAELMDELFATERAERLALMDRARKLDPEHPSTSTVKARPAVPTLPTVPAVPAPAASSDRRPWIALVAVAAVLVLAGIGWAMNGTSSDRPAALVTVPLDVGPRDAGPPMTPTVLDTGPPDVGLADAGRERERRRDDGPRRREVASGGGAASEGSGRLSVVTPPGWAEIFEGSRRLGRSPAELTLPAGRHVLRLVPYGEGRAIERTVTVEADGAGRLVVRLDPP